MAGRRNRFFICFVCVGILAVSLGIPVRASEGEFYYWSNEETGYRVIIDDAAGLLSDEEEAALAEQMEIFTEYGNAAFRSVDRNGISTPSYAESSYRNYFSSQSGMIFMIDMENHSIAVYCEGKMRKVIGNKEAGQIAEGVKPHIIRGEYADGAGKVFRQAYEKLEDHRAARPVKYLCNAMLALVCALLINFVWLNLSSKARRTNEDELIKNTLNYHDHSAPEFQWVRSFEERTGR